MKQIPEWGRLLQSPLFAPLHPVILRLKTDGFPPLEELNALLAAHSIKVESGQELRFVAQGTGRLAFEEQYEPRCYLKGEVQTRVDNWHDLFNALVWLTFPKAKAAINARHFRVLTEKRQALTEKRQALANTGAAQTPSQRGATRDTNTLLDESGVIVAYADDELVGLLRGFCWRELFWQRRGEVQDRMGFYLFGHGLYEKARQPYVGMAGQGLLLAVEQDFFNWPQPQQLTHLDRALAAYLADLQHCRSTRELSPVPLLGVPGWAAENERAGYYDNTAYFRPGRGRFCKTGNGVQL